MFFGCGRSVLLTDCWIRVCAWRLIGSQIRWIDVKNCALFHFANAYAEDVVGKDGRRSDTVITVVGSRLPTINFMQFEDHVAATKKGGGAFCLRGGSLDRGD